MKKFFLFIFLFVIAITNVCADEFINEPAQDPNSNYRLFKTANRWTFIQLDTETGKMWLIQYDINGNNRGGSVLNDENLATDKPIQKGRYTLYPTQNMWTFILLDQIDGSTWQVQWAFDKEDRFVIPLFLFY